MDENFVVSSTKCYESQKTVGLKEGVGASTREL